MPEGHQSATAASEICVHGVYVGEWAQRQAGHDRDDKNYILRGLTYGFRSGFQTWEVFVHGKYVVSES